MKSYAAQVILLAPPGTISGVWRPNAERICFHTSSEITRRSPPQVVVHRALMSRWLAPTHSRKLNGSLFDLGSGGLTSSLLLFLHADHPPHVPGLSRPGPLMWKICVSKATSGLCVSHVSTITSNLQMASACHVMSLCNKLTTISECWQRCCPFWWRSF